MMMESFILQGYCLPVDVLIDVILGERVILA